MEGSSGPFDATRFDTTRFAFPQKVSKFSDIAEASAMNRHIYALHREARWSMERLHNSADARYHAEYAGLFMKYLEDHTGCAPHGPAGGDFDELRRRFEDPKFPWNSHIFIPQLARRPYVVMELVDGQLLQVAIDGTKAPLDAGEKATVVRQCCEALVYMEHHGVSHRDFRGCARA